MESLKYRARQEMKWGIHFSQTTLRAEALTTQAKLCKLK